MHRATYRRTPSTTPGVVQGWVWFFSLANDQVVAVNHLQDGRFVSSMGTFVSFPSPYLSSCICTTMSRYLGTSAEPTP